MAEKKIFSDTLLETTATEESWGSSKKPGFPTTRFLKHEQWIRAINGRLTG